MQEAYRALIQYTTTTNADNNNKIYCSNVATKRKESLEIRI